MAILIDPGSVGNLCGDQWAKDIANEAHRHGLKPAYQKRRHILPVSGVGKGAEECAYDCLLPIAILAELCCVLSNLASFFNRNAYE